MTKEEYQVIDPFIALLVVKWAIALGLLIIACFILRWAIGRDL